MKGQVLAMRMNKQERQYKNARREYVEYLNDDRMHSEGSVWPRQAIQALFGRGRYTCECDWEESNRTHSNNVRALSTIDEGLAELTYDAEVAAKTARKADLEAKIARCCELQTLTIEAKAFGKYKEYSRQLEVYVRQLCKEFLHD